MPIEELAKLAAREGWRPRPIYGAHRWFARRLGTSMRAILTAAVATAPDRFWTTYYGGADWTDKTVLDPFVGGGTTVVEAQRLGAEVVGVDVNPVASAVTSFELRAREVPDLSDALRVLRRTVGADLARYYRTSVDGVERDVLHYFWVQAVTCAGCARTIEAHPHYQLAYEAEGTRQWAFCRFCHGVHELDATVEDLWCPCCRETTHIREGPVRYGRITCPGCSRRERLIDVAARTGAPPTWRLFAVEYLDRPAGASGRAPLTARRFRAAGDSDALMLGEVRAALAQRQRGDGGVQWVPDRPVPTVGLADGRLPRYGYLRYQQLFGDRQLLHLSRLAEAVAGLPEPSRAAVAVAFSDHLATNCMLTQYAFGWRRLAPLFSVRGYRHIPRPVELNPWLAEVGRGTFPNAVRQVQQAATFARSPREPLRDGGSVPVPDRAPRGSARVVTGSAERLGFLADGSVDLVLTDPPYFDNIPYGELSDFFVGWLHQFGLLEPGADDGLPAELVGTSRDDAAADVFASALGGCMREVARVLKPSGQLVFTYRHRTAQGWRAVGEGLAAAGFSVVQTFPLPGDRPGAAHAHPGSARWDAVFVARVTGITAVGRALVIGTFGLGAAERHFLGWHKRLADHRACPFGPADAENFWRGCAVSAALGMFGPPADGDAVARPLADILASAPPMGYQPPGMLGASG